MISAHRARAWAAVASSGALVLTLVPSAGAAPVTGTGDAERAPETTGIPSAPETPTRALAQEQRTATSEYPDWLMNQRLQARSDVLAPTVSAQVAEVRSGKVLWVRGADTPLMPASNQKVVTALTALKTFGPSHTYKTAVLRSTSSPRTVYLRGSGDPTLSSYRLRVMAAETATSMRKRGITRVALRYDDTLMPTPRNASGWQSGDVPRWVAPVRALVRDQLNLDNTSLDATTYFRAQLKARGITTTSTRRGTTPKWSVILSQRYSPAMRTIVADMLRVSQNDYAEALLWTAGIKAGAPRTWSGVTSHARRTLLAYGVPTKGVVIRDGSGLSRGDRQTARAMTTLMIRLRQDRTLGPVIYSSSALPISGRTGTLKDRYRTAPTSCAAGKIRAKTGSLRDAGSLSGIAVGTDGVERAFTVISNRRPSNSTLRGQIDAVAATTAKCM